MWRNVLSGSEKELACCRNSGCRCSLRSAVHGALARGAATLLKALLSPHLRNVMWVESSCLCFCGMEGVWRMSVCCSKS